MTRTVKVLLQGLRTCTTSTSTSTSTTEEEMTFIFLDRLAIHDYVLMPLIETMPLIESTKSFIVNAAK
jgi:hypothetical protein